MSHTQAHSRGFVVACPTHPDVILTREKRGFFGLRRRTEVVQDECPLCVQQWPFQGDDPPAEDWNTTSLRYFEPSAPFDDHHNMEEYNTTTRVEPRPQSPRNNSSIRVPVEPQSEQLNLTQSIMDMVHALLDRDNPTRGPNFVVDQLEMLCAWTLGRDPGVRLIVVDAGGIYIVVNVLQQCLERLPLPTNNPNYSVSAAERHEPSYFGGGETTLPTQTVDDATTIVTNEAELEDTYEEFDSMYEDNAPFPQYNAQTVAGPTASMPNDHSYPGSMYFPSTNRNSTSHAGASSQSQTTNTTSQSFGQGPYQHHSIISPPPPTMTDIDMAFGHFLAPTTTDTASNFDGNNTVATPSYQARPSYRGQPWHASYNSTASTPVIPTCVSHDAASYAPSVGVGSISNYTTASRRQAPSVSGSSVSAYVTPRTPGSTQRAAASHVGSEMDRIIQESRWGVATLANLSQEQANVDVIRSAKGIETLLGIMSRCVSDEMLQDCGCECLSTLISQPTSESRHIKGMITSYGGVSIVLNAMRLFPATPTLQHKCCLFISRMAASDPVVLQSIATLRGIELITLAMRLHQTDQELQEASCLALVTLLREAIHLRSIVIAAQGAEAILTAMWQFEANSLLQSYGCESLGYICINEEGSKRILVEAGAIETILSTMRAHNQNVRVQRTGCRALCDLTDDYGPAIQRAVANDAMTTIQTAAAHDPESAERLRQRLYQR